MTMAGHCHKDHSVPPEQQGEQWEPQVPTQVRPAVRLMEGWGPGQQQHWGAPCTRCQKGPDKLWAGKGTEVRQQGWLLPAQRDRQAERCPLQHTERERRCLPTLPEPSHGSPPPRCHMQCRREGKSRLTNTKRVACAGPRGPRSMVCTLAPPEGTGPSRQGHASSPCLSLPSRVWGPGGWESQR